MVPILSLVTSAKDYVEIVHKLLEFHPSNIGSVTDYTELGSFISYVVLTIKSFCIEILSFNWLHTIWNASTLWGREILVPDIASAMISEISVLDGYFHNAFTFLETPLSYGKQNYTFYGLEKFTIGFINSFFLFIPTSAAHIIFFRRLVFQGIEGGYVAGIGIIAGNILWLTSIIFGWRFFVIPWLSLDLLRYLLGFLILLKFMWHASREKRVLTNFSKSKIFLVSFLLAFTEQTNIYPFVTNMSVGAESSILETFPVDTLPQFLFVHSAYIVGLLAGSISLLNLTCWVWENPVAKIFRWLQLNESLRGYFSPKSLNYLFLYLTMLCTISSFPYFGLDYTITNPLGLVSDDRIFYQKNKKTTQVEFPEIAFLNAQGSDRNARDSRGRHGRRERWKERLIKYKGMDIALYNRGVYDLFPIEDLNYGFDKFWLRKRIRNHPSRFRMLIIKPQLLSLKKQLAKPRLLTNEGARVEVFRMIYELFYHPNFHAYQRQKSKISPPRFSPSPTLQLEQSQSKNESGSVSSVFSSFEGGKDNPYYNKKGKNSKLEQFQSDNKFENSLSALRKFVRKVNTRIKSSEILLNKKNLISVNNSVFSKRFLASQLSDLTQNSVPNQSNVFAANDPKSFLRPSFKSEATNYMQKENLSKKERQILRYKTNPLFQVHPLKLAPNQASSLREVNNAKTMLHPIKFYLQKEKAFRRKLKFYGASVFRKLSIGNNAPYFRIMMKRLFYYYKPTVRWTNTFKLAKNKQGHKVRKKRSRLPLKIEMPTSNSPFAFGFPKGLQPSVIATITDPASMVKSSPITSQEETRGSEIQTLLMKEPTHNFRIAGKNSSRHRNLIFKQALFNWYYTPFNRILSKLDVDSFIRRQPNSHFLTQKDEQGLHLKRFLLAGHYDTLRWYTYMQHYRSMKTKIGGTKSFASKFVYNQQFQGTLKKIRHLFAITPTLFSKTTQLNFSASESVPSGAPLFSQIFSPKVKNPGAYEMTDVLKFDQPLYNEYSNTQKNSIINDSVTHEELLSLSIPDQIGMFSAEGPNGLKLEQFPKEARETETGRISGANVRKDDFLAQSTFIAREYLKTAGPLRHKTIKNLLLEKNYKTLTKFIRTGKKQGGIKATPNQRLLLNQEYLRLPPLLNDQGAVIQTITGGRDSFYSTLFYPKWEKSKEWRLASHSIVQEFAERERQSQILSTRSSGPLLQGRNDFARPFLLPKEKSLVTKRYSSSLRAFLPGSHHNKKRFLISQRRVQKIKRQRQVPLQAIRIRGFGLTPRFQFPLRGKSEIATKNLNLEQNLWFSFLKTYKKGLYDKEFISKFVERRTKKREKRYQKKEKELRARLKRLKKWLVPNKSQKDGFSGVRHGPFVIETITAPTISRETNLLTTGLKKAIKAAIPSRVSDVSSFDKSQEGLVRQTSSILNLHQKGAETKESPISSFDIAKKLLGTIFVKTKVVSHVLKIKLKKILHFVLKTPTAATMILRKKSLGRRDIGTITPLQNRDDFEDASQRFKQRNGKVTKIRVTEKIKTLRSQSRLRIRKDRMYKNRKGLRKRYSKEIKKAQNDLISLLKVDRKNETIVKLKQKINASLPFHLLPFFRKNRLQNRDDFETKQRETVSGISGAMLLNDSEGNASSYPRLRSGSKTMKNIKASLLIQEESKSSLGSRTIPKGYLLKVSRLGPSSLPKKNKFRTLLNRIFLTPTESLQNQKNDESISIGNREGYIVSNKRLPSSFSALSSRQLGDRKTRKEVRREKKAGDETSERSLTKQDVPFSDLSTRFQMRGRYGFEQQFQLRKTKNRRNQRFGRAHRPLEHPSQNPLLERKSANMVIEKRLETLKLTSRNWNNVEAPSDQQRTGIEGKTTSKEFAFKKTPILTQSNGIPVYTEKTKSKKSKTLKWKKVRKSINSEKARKARKQSVDAVATQRAGSLIKQIKRAEYNLKLQQWWWHFIPTLQATNGISPRWQNQRGIPWQFEKERQSKQLIAKLSKTEILDGDLTNLKENPFSLQIGDYDFKPLAVPQALRLRDDLIQRHLLLTANETTQESPESKFVLIPFRGSSESFCNWSQKIRGKQTRRQSLRSSLVYAAWDNVMKPPVFIPIFMLEQSHKTRRIPKKKNIKTVGMHTKKKLLLNKLILRKSSSHLFTLFARIAIERQSTGTLFYNKEQLSSTLKPEKTSNLINRLYMNIFALSSAKITTSPRFPLLLKKKGEIQKEKWKGIKNVGVSEGNSFQKHLVNTNALPFYAGWDESVRKFVVTNRLLSRREAGSSATLVSASQNRDDFEAEIEFSNPPLQGMNAGTTLYSQIPFTTFDPDQLFSKGMDGFAPLGWRRFEFTHTIFKTQALRKWLNLRSKKNKTRDQFAVQWDKTINSELPLNLESFSQVKASKLEQFRENVKSGEKRVGGEKEKPLLIKSISTKKLQILPLSTEFIEAPQNWNDLEGSKLKSEGLLQKGHSYNVIYKLKKREKFINLKNRNSFLNNESNIKKANKYSRRLHRHYKRTRRLQNEKAPIFLISGPLINEVLPVHYINVFNKQTRLSKDRYLKRRLRRGKKAVPKTIQEFNSYSAKLAELVNPSSIEKKEKKGRFAQIAMSSRFFPFFNREKNEKLEQLQGQKAVSEKLLLAEQKGGGVYNFTFRRRLKTRRKYHRKAVYPIKRGQGVEVRPRRHKFLAVTWITTLPFFKTLKAPESLQIKEDLSPSQDNKRTLSEGWNKKLTRKRPTRRRSKKRLNDGNTKIKKNSPLNSRLRQLRRRVSRQVIKTVPRRRPRAGGFVWPGGGAYLRLEQTASPKLILKANSFETQSVLDSSQVEGKNSNGFDFFKKAGALFSFSGLNTKKEAETTSELKKVKQKITRKIDKRALLLDLYVQPRKYLLEKHNIKVIKKKLEKAQRANQIQQRLQEFNSY